MKNRTKMNQAGKLEGYLAPERVVFTGKKPITKRNNPVICITTANIVNIVNLLHVKEEEDEEEPIILLDERESNPACLKIFRKESEWE